MKRDTDNLMLSLENNPEDIVAIIPVPATPSSDGAAAGGAAAAVTDDLAAAGSSPVAGAGTPSRRPDDDDEDKDARTSAYVPKSFRNLDLALGTHEPNSGGGGGGSPYAGAGTGAGAPSGGGSPRALSSEPSSPLSPSSTSSAVSASVIRGTSSSAAMKPSFHVLELRSELIRRLPPYVSVCARKPPGPAPDAAAATAAAAAAKKKKRPPTVPLPDVTPVARSMSADDRRVGRRSVGAGATELREGLRVNREEPVSEQRQAHLRARAAFVKAALQHSGSHRRLVTRATHAAAL